MTLDGWYDILPEFSFLMTPNPVKISIPNMTINFHRVVTAGVSDLIDKG